jgi:hypothetical protein
MVLWMRDEEEENRVKSPTRTPPRVRGTQVCSKIIVAGFGVALFAFELVVLRAGVGVRALAAVI